MLAKGDPLFKDCMKYLCIPVTPNIVFLHILHVLCLPVLVYIYILIIIKLEHTMNSLSRSPQKKVVFMFINPILHIENIYVNVQQVEPIKPNSWVKLVHDDSQKQTSAEFVMIY